MFISPMPLIVVLAAVGFLSALIMIFWVEKNRSNRLHWVLRAVAALLLVGAGLRPYSPSLVSSELYNKQFDVYFVVDLTSSMVAEDAGPEGETRLQLVREDINDLMDAYVGAKFSLITFNSTAVLRVPLTPDSTAVASAVNTMLPEVTAYSKGSSISAPVELLTETLANADSNNSETDRAKIVLYFGDGEQTQPDPPGSFSPAAEYTTQSKVYGYGTVEGGRMKTQTGYYINTNTDEYIKDSTGADGLSVIDETNLETIASELNGTYEHRSWDETVTPAELTDQQKLELQSTDETATNATELYWVFLIPLSLILFYEAAVLLRRTNQLGVKFR